MSKVQLPYSPTDFHQIRNQPHSLPNYFENVPGSVSDMSRAQLPYSLTEFRQIRHQPYPSPNDFENVPDSGSGMYRTQLPYSLFATNTTLCKQILKVYLISCSDLSKVQLPSSPNRLSPNSQPTPLFLLLKMYLISGLNLPKVQLPYSPIDFHQIRNRLYPLPTVFEKVPGSSSSISKVELPYSPTDFHQIRHEPYPLPTDSENVPDFRFSPKCNFLIPRRITIKFDMDPTFCQPILKMYNYVQCTWCQAQTCPAERGGPASRFIILLLQ